MSDIIYLHQLKVKTVIGILPYERLSKQTLILNLDCHTDIRPAGQSDKIEDALDYRKIIAEIEQFANHAQYQLIEAFAEALCQHLLATFPNCSAFQLQLQKPGALPHTQALGLKIYRGR